MKNTRIIVLASLSVFCLSVVGVYTYYFDTTGPEVQTWPAVVHVEPSSGRRSSTEDDNTAGINVNVLVHARMRTGSTLAGSYFAAHPDFFYVYEPGYMLIEHKGMDFYEDSFDYLESIRHELTDFMHAFYNCNFTNRDYYFDSLMRHSFMRTQAKIPWQRNREAMQSSVTKLCRSKRHVVTKTIRLNNVLLAAPMLKKDHVKIVHLVRDPRGMTSSRSVYGDLRRKQDPKHDEKQRQMIKNYCAWLDNNSVSSANADPWFKDNYFLIRYEDLSDRPAEFVPKLYDFVGVPMHPTIQKKVQQPGNKIGNGEKWRTKLTYEEVKEIQELCPEEVLKRVGYGTVHSAEELRNASVSFLLPISSVEK